MNPYIAEFIGTLVLVLLGDGVCAACSLNHSKAKGAGWSWTFVLLIAACLLAIFFMGMTYKEEKAR